MDYTAAQRRWLIIGSRSRRKIFHRYVIMTRGSTEMARYREFCSGIASSHRVTRKSTISLQTRPPTDNPWGARYLRGERQGYRDDTLGSSYPITLSSPRQLGEKCDATVFCLCADPLAGHAAINRREIFRPAIVTPVSIAYR